MSPSARLLPTRMIEKVWGRDHLPDPFTAPAGKRIGEIWFEPPAELDQLLVKYLFTSEKLSVQVHPGEATVHAGEAPKEECWLVLDADPGAQLAIGFDREHDGGEIEAAARDGSIERLLTWHDVSAGDIFYLPAGTVHAIGAGISLVEIQQNSDTTFRLYDYGRPRELHLERAMAVAHLGPHNPDDHATVSARGQKLIDRHYFRVDRIEGTPDTATREAFGGSLLALPLEGELSTPAGEMAKSGQCLFAPTIDALDFSAARITLLVRSNP